jgi:peptidoglycan/xylan/chitin deacetylase (PgdA/CDA1 family)
VDSLDWQSKNADAIYQTVTKEVYPGSIILMHDIYDTSVDGAQKVIPALKKQGYTFVTVSDLIQSKLGPLKNNQRYFDANEAR